jgi:hypothetical protein
MKTLSALMIAVAVAVAVAVAAPAWAQVPDLEAEVTKIDRTADRVGGSHAVTALVKAP